MLFGGLHEGLYVQGFMEKGTETAAKSEWGDINAIVLSVGYGWREGRLERSLF